MRVAILIILVAAAAFPASAATPPRLSLPYDIEVDPAGRLVIADGGKHQIYRWDARRKALVVIAGTGRAGATGDGGPARKARIDEIAGIALDRRGNLYLADVHYGTVRRIDRRGVITTVLRLPGAVGVAVDLAGRYLAVGSIAKGVLRIELVTGAQEPVVAVGEHGLQGPHGLAYDARGNLWIADPGGWLLRIDATTQEVQQVAHVSAGKVVPLADGGALLLSGGPSGGRVQRLAPDGKLTTVAGTGRLGPHRDGIAATRAGIMPTDAAMLAGGAILVAQAEPIPAIRRIDRNGKITTLVR